ncbi:MAG: hypothetical protein CL844_03610 [Crocinitomicaceae bacterium]|nr:hypothetical protein [Crocinitomicaceae bacterium]
MVPLEQAAHHGPRAGRAHGRARLPGQRGLPDLCGLAGGLRGRYAQRRGVRRRLGGAQARVGLPREAAARRAEHRQRAALIFQLL